MQLVLIKLNNTIFLNSRLAKFICSFIFSKQLHNFLVIFQIIIYIYKRYTLLSRDGYEEKAITCELHNAVS